MVFEYTIAAHPTVYADVRFRSRLEATWAAFFDYAEWEWKYEPADFKRWSPDFWVSFPCGHSECAGSHELLVEVKPYFDLRQFNGHEATKIEPYSYPSPAIFGIDPSVTYWEMGHGSGGGDENVARWVSNWKQLWALASNETQWKPS